MTHVCSVFVCQNTARLSQRAKPIAPRNVGDTTLDASSEGLQRYVQHGSRVYELEYQSSLEVGHL